MKYVFVINPAAGRENSEDGLLQQLNSRKDLDYEIYYTKAPHDAADFVINTCAKHPDEQFCFVAAGGDGTLNEVVNGAARCQNASFGCWPCGSGNDFIKYYGEVENAANLDNLIKGTLKPIDLMLINGETYSMNVIDIGFDSVAVETMDKVRRKPLIGGKNAYTTGVIAAVLAGRRHKGTISVDGNVINPDGEFMLATFANGNYIGGGYKAAPRAVADDGLIDVCLAAPISIPRLASLIGYYRKGEHLDNEKFSDFLTYCRGRKVELSSDKPFSIVVDGEMMKDSRFTIEIVDKKTRFLVPYGSKKA
ncbi:MAG: YegS/Rv2252/BmrU family lipid kinase [Erysipelotrichaceae bacterium]|nr:YegS/Rv2252/BmrU family lipid kinase [Erysipelotrichaceae bacterium]